MNALPVGLAVGGAALLFVPSVRRRVLSAGRATAVTGLEMVVVAGGGVVDITRAVVTGNARSSGATAEPSRRSGSEGGD